MKNVVHQAKLWEYFVQNYCVCKQSLKNGKDMIGETLV